MNTLELQAQGVEGLLRLLPAQPGHFDGSQYPLPVKTTIIGNGPLDLPALRSKLSDLASGDVKHLLEPLLVAAEAVESVAIDRQQRFLTDADVRGRVFTGSKWMAGWALVLGERNRLPIIAKLQERGFMCFVDAPGIEKTTFIGDRDTSPIYFLQMMVRYGLIWGQIAPGDAHEMGHFLERDMPGMIIITEDLPPLKYLIALGMMKLGAPAVVPSSFPFPYGNRIVADTADEAVDHGSHFENLRAHFYRDQVISLPSYCNPAYAQEKFAVAQQFGGTANSFFCVRPGKVEVTSNRVIGSGARAGAGAGAGDVGVLIAIEEKHFTDDVALTIEREAIKAIGFLPGIRGYEKDGRLHIEAAEKVEVQWQQVAEVVAAQVRLHYPRIEHIALRVILDAAECARLAPDIQAYKQQRKTMVEGMTEENTDQFVVCTECRPFSLVHTCIVTPDRTPMCAARSYASIKAAALFGFAGDPYKRRSEEDIALRTVFNRGAVIDAARGEYEGANRMYREMTRGKLQRVFLHSVRDFPHTSCGCFQTLVFWIDEAKGLGIMGRGSKAVAPNGMTWDLLANRAGGKQSDGVMGVSVAYIRSRHFMKGDGGIANVVWVDSGLLPKIRDTIPAGQRVATELDVATTDQLRAFVKQNARR